MSTILIVSKTRMKNGVCVGGIDEDSYELIRIHDENGGNLPLDAPYEIGDRWEMEVEQAWNARPKPHTEDRQVRPIRKIDRLFGSIALFIKNNLSGNRIVKGPINLIFEGCLKFYGTKNFITHDNVPSFSTQFWIADKDLIHSEQWEKHYYIYNNNIRIKYVGYEKPVNKISAGTLIRLSLANWWDDGSGEEKCYLQLSGWYYSFIID